MTEISKEYASALFEIAREKMAVDETAGALRLVLEQFEAAPEYANLLSSPNIPIKERRFLIEEAFSKYLPDYLLSFVMILCEKGHIKELSQCVDEYNAMNKAFSKVSEARIISAIELTENEKEALLKKLEIISGHTVNANYEIDEKIIGGLVIYIDDKVIDGSLRHKLKEIKEGLGI